MFAYIKANVKVLTIFGRTAGVWAEDMQRIFGFRTTDRKIKALIVPPLLTSFLTLLIVMGSQLLFLMSHEGQRIVPEKPLQDKAHSVANSVARTEEPELWNIKE